MDIREKFLDYFKAHGHQVYDSMPLVPNDASLLFTNAGMVQFKDIFTGKIPAPKIPRATSSQLCIRAGGKHNDLENVGYTARHHTLFEMLGNFSFGDYFKEEVIEFAWQFITRELGFSKDKIYISIHHSDDEAFGLWKKFVGEDKIKRFGDKDNFWQMGEVGPCGPCSEIYIDQGEANFSGSEDYFGGDGDRFLEIWNLVFMQYERDKNGNLRPLPRPSIDTGMGLERVIALIEGKLNNFDTSLFAPLMSECENLTGKPYSDEFKASFRVIADHIRSIAFLLAQGVNFDKDGRGYVLRRILRRALRHGYLLGLKEAFLYKLIPALCKSMAHYAYLEDKKAHIMEQCKLEEERFLTTIESGMKLFEKETDRLIYNDEQIIEKNSEQIDYLLNVADVATNYPKLNKIHMDKINKSVGKYKKTEAEIGILEQRNKFDGEIAFKLYDTYGFPLDLTQDMLKPYNYEVDLESFNKCMEAQKSRSKKSWKGSGDEIKNGDFGVLLEEFGENKFIGYEADSAHSKILGLLDINYRRVECLDGDGYIFLDSTPLYAEGGGPVGDSGEIFMRGKKVANVIYTKKYFGLNISEISTSSELKVGDLVEVRVSANRIEISKHHSATHLLHSALRKILGSHITQAGSLVEANRLRFDITHPKALSKDELNAIEAEVNTMIFSALDSKVDFMSLNDAKKGGAIALFGEKYGEVVRVVSFGDDENSASCELCGGIHIQNTAQIGNFYITKESGISSGVRRIEAVCGKAGYNYTKENLAILTNAREVLKNSDIMSGIAKLKENIQKYKDAKSKTDSSVKSLNFEMIDEVKLMIVEVAANLNIKAIIDEAKKENPKVAIMLIANDNGKISISCGVNGVANLSAKEWIKGVCEVLGGGGGGRDDFATAGGKNPHKIKEALQIARDFALEKIQSDS
ncbi:alanine--tRNA ligase [Helicobacter sp. 23-1045]